MKKIILACTVWMLFFFCSENERSLNYKSKSPAANKINDSINKWMNAAESLRLIQPDSAFAYAGKALAASNSAEFLDGIGRSHQLIGEVFFHQGVFVQALEHLLEAEKIFKITNDVIRMGANLNLQGLVYYQIKQPELSLEHHQEALSLYESANNKQGMAYSLGCIGRLYEKRQQYEEALQYQQQALEMYQAVDDDRGHAIILENIGSIYEDLENYTIAEEHFLRSLALNQKTNDSLSMIINLNNVGDVYRKTNQLEKALHYSRSALMLAERLGEKYQVSSAYKDLSKIYNQLNQHREAYEHLEAGRTIYEEMYGQEASRQLALMQTLFEIERKNFSIQQLENQQKLSQVVKIGLGGSLLLFILLGSVVISRQRLKIRQEKETIVRNQEVYETQTRLMKVELENTHLHEQQLQAELDARAKSLTAHALHIMSKNKILEDIQARLNELLKEDMQEQRKRAKGIIKMIENNFVQDKDWDDFRTIFEQVHQHFFDNLQKISAELTPADIRLAALMRLNLPSKDISTILGISPDSLRISRYRLRKKLKLDPEESLTHFILSI